MILTKDGIDRYFLDDYESGYLYEVSKTYYEQHNAWMKKMWEDARIKINTEYKSVPIIMGTGGSMEMWQKNDFNLIFFNPVWDAVPDPQLTGYFMARQFIQPEPLKDNDLMPFGKHKGIIMEKVPAKYLLYMYENSEDLDGRVKEYIVSNLDVIKQQAKSEG